MGGVNQIPADAAVLAVGGGAVKCARQLLLAPCRLLHVLAPSFSCFATHANAGAFRTGFSLAARRSRKSTGFCRGVWRCIYGQYILRNLGKRGLIARIMAYVERYKNLYLFVQQKKPLNQRLFLFRHKKGDRPLRTVAFVNCCEACLRRES